MIFVLLTEEVLGNEREGLVIFRKRGDDREKRVQQKQREVHITAAAAADRKLVHRGTDNAI